VHGVKEDELRERLLELLPTLRHPTFTVIHGQVSSRVKRGLLDRTLRHLRQDGLVEAHVSRVGGHTVRRYQITQQGLSERARLLLAKRRHAS
jgi:DNA-binding PadR family transcriptional regulator